MNQRSGTGSGDPHREQHIGHQPSRLLAVDDDARTRRLYEAFGKSCGYDVTVVESGLAALRALGEADRGFDAMLLDIVMPDMDGLSLLRIIRAEARWRSLPVIVVTGWVGDNDQQAIEAAGCDAYCRKPVDLAMLREVIEAVLPPGDRYSRS